MATATIKLFLPFGDGKRLRTAEISNWSGKALAAPRTDFSDLLARIELSASGIYFLIGNDPATGKPMAYIGEAEVLSDRLKQHKTKEFWVSAIVFVSKDENLTKSHIRHLEGRLIEEAYAAKRFNLDNGQASGSKLPEADKHDMEEFLEKVRQLLPVLGCDVLTPIGGDGGQIPNTLTTEIKGLVARGHRTTDGFVVLAGSQAVLEHRRSAEQYAPASVAARQRLQKERALLEQNGHLIFTRDVEFPGPTAAATVIHGGNVNAQVVWKNSSGVSIGELEKE